MVATDNRLWVGKHWQNRIDLGGNSTWVKTLSADGKIAGGKANNDNNDGRAVIWSGKHWQTKTDLGNLKADNSGESEVNALSADGKIAGGGLLAITVIGGR